MLPRPPNARDETLCEGRRAPHPGMNLDTATPTDIRAPEARGYGAPHGAAICGCKEGGP